MDGMNDGELSGFLNRMTLQLGRLTEIAEAQAARQLGVMEQIIYLKKQAMGMQNALNHLRATYNQGVPPAGAFGGQREAVGQGAKELREASPQSVDVLPPSDRA